MMPGLDGGDTSLVSAATGGGSGGGSGGSPTLDTQTVYTGIYGSLANENKQVGYIYAVMGSISPGTSAIYASAAIKQMYAAYDGSSVDVILQVAGSVANSGWTTMVIAGSVALYRANATFGSVGGNSQWTWPNAGNPFGGGGTTANVSFY